MNEDKEEEDEYGVNVPELMQVPFDGVSQVPDEDQLQEQVEDNQGMQETEGVEQDQEEPRPQLRQSERIQ